MMSGIFNGVPGGWLEAIDVDLVVFQQIAVGGDVPFEKKLWYVRSPAGTSGREKKTTRL